MRRFFLYFYLLWMGAMLYLLLIPGSIYHGHRFFEGEDKVVHFILFFVWAFCLSYLLSRKQGFAWSKTATYVIVSGLGFAIATELIQIYVPHRTEDIGDFIADAIGTTVGFGATFILKKELICIEKKFDN